MAKNFNSEPGAIPFSRGKSIEKTSEEDTNEKRSSDSPQGNKSCRCYKYEKIEHIKKNCRVKLFKANVAFEDEEDDQLNWEQCFTTEVVERRGKMVLKSITNKAVVNYVNYKEEWIIDFGCSHHVTKNDS